jgi:hypothetical protein
MASHCSTGKGGESMIIAASISSGGGFTGSIIFFVSVLVGFAAYWVPTIVAVVRQVPSKGSIIVINFFLGWTIIGWVVALAMAVRTRPQQPQYLAPPGWTPPPGLHWAPPGAGPTGWTPPGGPQGPPADPTQGYS